MSKTKTLDKMRANPKGDWGIKDIESVCTKLDITITPPSSGSHYKVSSPYLSAILPIPAKRPIKPFYIKEFVAFCEAHMMRMEKS